MKRIVCDFPRCLPIFVRFINNESSSIEILNSKTPKTKKSKIIRAYSIPKIDDNERKSIKSIVGIQVSTAAVSWACLEKEHSCITDLQLEHLPMDVQKYDLNSLYDLVCSIVEKFPAADRYILETIPKPGRGTTGILQLSLLSTRLHFTAMLVTLLNKRYKNENSNWSVIFVKHRLPARLFKILVGNEQVSTEPIIGDIFKGKIVSNCMPLNVDNKIQTDYTLIKTAPERELLGQALLLTVTFFNIVLLKNENAIQIVLPSRIDSTNSDQNSS